jgi:hypothetical protein
MVVGRMPTPSAEALAGAVAKAATDFGVAETKSCEGPEFVSKLFCLAEG